MNLDLPPNPSAARTPVEGEVLVKVEGVSKKFCRSLKKSLWYGVSDIFSEFKFLGNRPTEGSLRKAEFWAVQDISFELRRGECLGLIGRNGAGKTTLLKMLNGLIKPDSGRIEMRGRIGALIALGAGFNPILTGRENIYVNASVLGLSKQETDSKIDEIIDFAEIREFIDTPVQNYSSGMQVRLGFAVATALEPDVLILDEVLAVGDLAFRLKCYRRIDAIRDRAAVIFVSHSIEQIGRICSSVLLMDKSRMLHSGEVSHGLELYENMPGEDEQIEVATHCSPPLLRAEAILSDQSIPFGDPLQLVLEMETSDTIAVTMRVAFFQFPNQTVAGTAESCVQDANPVQLAKGRNKFNIWIDHTYLRPGKYVAAVAVFEAASRTLLFVQRGDLAVNIQGSFYSETHHLMPLHVSPL